MRDAALQNTVRVAVSQTLASIATLEIRLRAGAEAALHRAGLPAPTDLRRLHAQFAALHRAADGVLLDASRQRSLS